ncbi:MAG: 1-acyl-sn-glycerol-3-phosphate acyltransferase [Rubrobacter sp.]|nr:1-acyl-sn-glycerol-3-phosphate acyltransferase [Rubrobacter sp.]
MTKQANESPVQTDEEVGPTPVREISEEDRALLENPAAKRVWDLLTDRYPDRRLDLDTSLHGDLGVDSMEWVSLWLAIGRSVGVELDEEAIERVESVRDLLGEVTERAEAGGAAHVASPLEQPEEDLSDEQKRYLEPLGPAMSVMARGMFALNRAIFRGAFRLSVEGMENLPEEGPFVVTPNHTSYLDSFAVAAALDYRRMRRTYWAAYVGAAFGNPINGFVSRLAKAVPIDADEHAVSSLAFGAAVLKRANNLVWFPGGQRSPTGELQEFKPGIGALLAHFRVPVVPTSISGSYKAMPPGKTLPRPTKITVMFGRPLSVDELERRGDGEGPQDRIVQALHDHLAELIARS